MSSYKKDAINIIFLCVYVCTMMVRVCSFFVKNCVEENFLFAHNQKNPEFISRAMYWFSLNFQRHNNFIVCVCLYVRMCVWIVCIWRAQGRRSLANCFYLFRTSEAFNSRKSAINQGKDTQRTWLSTFPRQQWTWPFSAEKGVLPPWSTGGFGTTTFPFLVSIEGDEIGLRCLLEMTHSLLFPPCPPSYLAVYDFENNISEWNTSYLILRYITALYECGNIRKYEKMLREFSHIWTCMCITEVRGDERTYKKYCLSST